MRKLTIVALPVVLLFASVAASHAAYVGLPNQGFETGDLTNWPLVFSGPGQALVVSSWVGAGGTEYEAIDGNFFLALNSKPTTVVQPVTLKAGDVLDGWAAFDAEDGPPARDMGAVIIFDSATDLTDEHLIAAPWVAGIETGLENTAGPWTYWNWTAPADGDYTLGFAFVEGDGISRSWAFFDYKPTGPTPSPVPEPGTLALLLMGLPMAGLLRRRK